MFKRILAVLLIGILAWAYQTTCPPPPKVCGSPGGPPVIASRIKLRDGRYLAYEEHGVPKEIAKYKIISVHGFGCTRLDTLKITSEKAEELGVYFVAFDRPGYGESDPDPNRSVKSLALDIEELGDQLGLGSKFYVLGFSMGGQAVWGCLKYIPHRLAGAGLVAPVVNYWWPSFPANISEEAYNEQFRQDQWALRVAHYMPWLTYWWNTQQWFPASSVASGRPKLSRSDIELITKSARRQENKGYTIQQGAFESMHRDMIVGFGRWEFDPMDLKNPFSGNEGSVHLWQGDDDGLVPLTLQRYIVERLSWIQYHELPGYGHLFPLADGMTESIVKTLLLGNK